MNYIEYMKDGNKTDYSDYIPLQTVGPFSTLTLKRNNWIKAIRDAIVSIKNHNAKNNAVVTSGTQSNINGNVPTVNNTSGHSYTYPANNYSVVSRVYRPLGDE